MPIAITDTQRALAESIRNWAARAHPLELVRAGEREPAAGGPVWRALADIGLFGIAVPEELGGAAASVADAAAAVEAAAAVLAPGPIPGTVLAAALLGRHPDEAAAKELAPALAAGAAQAAVALDPGAATARTLDDGGLVVDGEVGLVLGAHAGAHLLLGTRLDDGQDRWFVLAPGTGGVTVETVTPMDLSRPLARVRLAAATVPATAVIAGLRTQTVVDWTLTLATAEAAGVADWCVRTAADYAGVREQFGRKIGSFQAVKQLCADMLCRSEQAAALAWDAARAADDDPAQHGFAAAAAAAAALEAAVDNAKDCIQVLGGIGFTWEHDAHFYLRRAVALKQLLGGGARWRRRVARLAVDGVRRRAEVDPAEYAGDDATAVAAERAEIAARAAAIAAAPEADRRAELAASGYLVPHWPRPYGLDASPLRQLAIDAELDRAGVARPNLVIGGWAAPTILEHGTPHQAQRFVWPTLRGEITWCQLFSEPGAGSDLAALRTKAERVPDGWQLTGQKVWTSLAHHADWAICLARTDATVAKHKGITYFLVDMRSPGIEIRPLREITGDVRFNEVFLTDVFVPDECVVGEVNGGWRLARTTLANERVAMSGSSSLGEALEALVAVVRSGRGGETGPDELGRLVVEAAGCAALDLRAVVRSLGGQDPGPESSVRKLIGVHHRQAVAELAQEMLGADGAVGDDTVGSVQYEFLLSRCLSIAGGTTQVLRNVAAERLLGLPRE